MSDAWNFLEKGTKKVAKAFGKVTGIDTLDKAAQGIGGKDPVKKPPGPPTIDQAAQNQQITDRIRQRRGELRNIYGGGAGAAPTVGTKTLTGQ